jgi:TPR repeat protein
VEQDYKTAFDLYRRSAAQRNPYAFYEVAKMYRDGIGTDNNESGAVLHFKEAFTGFVSLEERGGDDKLQYRIGQMLYTGTGAEKDTAAAIGYFEKAAGLGNVHAQYALAKAVLETDSDAGRIAEAALWMQRAADSGSEQAQYALGKLYLIGEHVPKDVDRAVALFEQAAAQGSQ